MGFPHLALVGPKYLVQGATAVIAAPTTAGAGLLYEARGYRNWTFQVRGIGTATVVVYGTIDPNYWNKTLGQPVASATTVDWSPLASLTADGFYYFGGVLLAVAAGISTYTSGTIDVIALASP